MLHVEQRAISRSSSRAHSPTMTPVGRRSPVNFDATPVAMSSLDSAASPRSVSPPKRWDGASSWMSSSVWSQGGESYTTQHPKYVGSPGQDLARFTEGPSAYLNGTPNRGSKSTLTRSVRMSPRGKFVQGVNTGPGDMTKIVLDRKVHCKRSNAGPDPYGLNNAIGSARNSSPRSMFAPEDGSTRQPWVYGLTRGQAFDRYHVHSRNQWRHTSNSIKSILANPMPQTPRASPFRPSAFGRVLDRSPRTAGSYSRIRSAGPSAAMAGVDVARLRFGISGNPFH